MTLRAASRPLKGEVPTIDVVAAHHGANTSPILQRFLARIAESRAAAASSSHGRSANNR
ncbi:MAG: hypothetical protein JOZ74_17755 [Bradyrhizobium sp.]|nr:hypothetical protein [Bradyrhizobium sp.]